MPLAPVWSGAPSFETHTTRITHTLHTAKRVAHAHTGSKAAKNPDKQGIPDHFPHPQTPQNVGLSPPPKRPKMTSITIYSELYRGSITCFPC